MSNITKSFINGYRDQERNKGRLIAPDLLTPDHTILNPRSLYPEYHLDPPYAIHRPGVNIALLIFFYRQVIAYVPPMKRRQFKHRFGIPYSTFLNLAYPGSSAPRFILPVLDHPSKYSSPETRAELSELLVRKPPTWERWHAALHSTQGDVWFSHADAAFNYPAMWSIPELRDLWRERLATSSESYVSREIKQQIRNNYTDLCLVGLQHQADRIARDSHSDPEFAINDLFYSSDLYAYPKVLGAGGVANIRATQAPLVVPHRPIDDTVDLLPSTKYFDSDVLEALLHGLRFDSVPNELRTDFLLAWHMSNNARTARNAYLALLNSANQQLPPSEDLHSNMKSIIQELHEFCRNAEPANNKALRIAQARQNVVSAISTIGGIACAIAGLFLLDALLIAGLGVGVTLIGFKTWSTKERVIEKLLARHAPRVSPDLFWSYRSMRDFSEDFFRRAIPSSRLIQDPFFPGTTSVPVRTVWWSNNFE